MGEKLKRQLVSFVWVFWLVSWLVVFLGLFAFSLSFLL